MTSIITAFVLWCVILIVIFLVLITISMGFIIPHDCANYYTNKFLHQSCRFFFLSFWIILIVGFIFVDWCFPNFAIVFGRAIKCLVALLLAFHTCGMLYPLGHRRWSLILFVSACCIGMPYSIAVFASYLWFLCAFILFIIITWFRKSGRFPVKSLA